MFTANPTAPADSITQFKTARFCYSGRETTHLRTLLLIASCVRGRISADCVYANVKNSVAMWLQPVTVAAPKLNALFTRLLHVGSRFPAFDQFFASQSCHNLRPQVTRVAIVLAA